MHELDLANNEVWLIEIDLDDGDRLQQCTSLIHQKSRDLKQGIDQRIPFTMFGTHKGVVYLNQHNIKSFMKLSEVKKFCDGTLIKIRENLVDMVKRRWMSRN
ncbi:hypothetical protein Tco_1212915 [Tanacetum coccineum]